MFTFTNSVTKRQKASPSVIIGSVERRIIRYTLRPQEVGADPHTKLTSIARSNSISCSRIIRPSRCVYTLTASGG